MYSPMQMDILRARSCDIMANLLVGYHKWSRSFGLRSNKRGNATVFGLVIKTTAHLKWLGGTFPTPGLAARPGLQEDWLPDFRWTCEGDVAHRLGSFCDA